MYLLSYVQRSINKSLSTVLLETVVEASIPNQAQNTDTLELRQEYQVHAGKELAYRFEDWSSMCSTYGVDVKNGLDWYSKFRGDDFLAINAQSD